MKILITGGTGFLGTALTERLVTEGHAVVSLGTRQADLTSPDALAPWSDQRFDRIYHLAAWTQAGDFCLHHPGEQWVRNQQINTAVLAWWQARQAQAKLIAIGTSCAYAPEGPLSEDRYFDGQPIDSLYTYAMTKRMLLVGLKALERQYGLRYLYLVPSTLYGPGYHADGRQMHFIFDLMRKILAAAAAGGPPAVLWGDGRQRRELVYVDDFVEAMLRLSDSVSNEVVNVGAGEEHTIREFAQAICELAGHDFREIRFDTSKYVGATSKLLAIDKLRRLLPDLKLTPLGEGLKRTLAWMKAAKIGQ